MGVSGVELEVRGVQIAPNSVMLYGVILSCERFSLCDDTGFPLRALRLGGVFCFKPSTFSILRIP